MSNIQQTRSFCLFVPFWGLFVVLPCQTPSKMTSSPLFISLAQHILCAVLLLLSQDCPAQGFRQAALSRRIGARPNLYLAKMRLKIDNNHGASTPGIIVCRRRVFYEYGALLGAVSLCGPNTVLAAPAKAPPADPMETLTAARETLQSLLDNWEKAVIDCTFADVPRELLEQKNKEQLLEKASTFALFDKSVSVETCKTTNRVVRDYLGATGIGPLVNLEKQMKRALDRVNPDLLDDYVTEIESIEQTLAKARSLSYTAGVADFSSVNNFEKDQVEEVLANNSNLEQSRRSIEELVRGLVKIEAMFE